MCARHALADARLDQGGSVAHARLVIGAIRRCRSEIAAELQKTIDEPIVNSFRLPDDNNEPPIWTLEPRQDDRWSRVQGRSSR